MFKKNKSYKDVARAIIVSEEGKELITKTLDREFGIKAVNYIIKNGKDEYLTSFRCDAEQWRFILWTLDEDKEGYYILERCF